MSYKPRVVVAMSGGVDSAVAAALLMEQGCEVVGISLKLLPGGAGSGLERADRCSSIITRRAERAVTVKK